ncbi:hypothetical protein CEP49_06640 [Mergibacter septicus]|uniref:hypothetical protein n=1 Tax=Mergibacter septicus TaxID=221402 RepID=UPI001179690D|nr:hypothetical protein [Mergibacter septicus]AWX14248.1 hypothetical protein CEP49_06640 [Mergibacter septicus]
MTDKTRKVRMTLEIEIEEYQRDTLSISKKTKVLGGKIVRLNWEGGLFEEVDSYRQLFNELSSNSVCLIFDNLKDQYFLTELQLAIKRAIKPILRDKLKELKQ